MKNIKFSVSVYGVDMTPWAEARFGKTADKFTDADCKKIFDYETAHGLPCEWVEVVKEDFEDHGGYNYAVDVIAHYEGAETNEMRFDSLLAMVKSMTTRGTVYDAAIRELGKLWEVLDND